MKDNGVIRKAYFDALNGNITWDTTQIPIVDEKLEPQISQSDNYILIGAQNEVDKSHKTGFVVEVELVITIVNRRNSTNSKVQVEGISDIMLGILFPSINTNGLSVPSPYKLTYAKMIAGEYRFTPLQSGGWQISKQIKFKNRLTQ